MELKMAKKACSSFNSTDSVVFKRLTLDSINNIKENILNERTKLELQKYDKEEKEDIKNYGLKSRSLSTVSKAPNKDLEAGKILPRKYLNNFPLVLAGVPVEELDDYYKADYVSFITLFDAFVVIYMP